MFSAVGLVFGFLQGLTIDEFWASLLEPTLPRKVAIGFLLYVIIIFFRQLDRILGPGVLLSYLLGRYHRPHREARIFMFLDLKSSTSLAEELGHEVLAAGENFPFVADEKVTARRPRTGRGG